jgi:hypothetical protein
MHHFLCHIEFHPVLTRLSFCQSASTAATYIFTAPTCTTTIITSNLVHYMLSFTISYWDLIKLPYFADLTQREDRGWKEAPKTGWRQDDYNENSIFIILSQYGDFNIEAGLLTHLAIKIFWAQRLHYFLQHYIA